MRARSRSMGSPRSWRSRCAGRFTWRTSTETKPRFSLVTGNRTALRRIIHTTRRAGCGSIDPQKWPENRHFSQKKRSFCMEGRLAGEPFVLFRTPAGVDPQLFSGDFAMCRPVSRHLSRPAGPLFRLPAAPRSAAILAGFSHGCRKSERWFPGRLPLRDLARP
jgi:hypothetical protein